MTQQGAQVSPEDCAGRWWAWWWSTPARRRCRRWQTRSACRGETDQHGQRFTSSLWSKYKQILQTVWGGTRLSPLVTFKVASGKLLHQPVDLLGLPRQPETLQEGSEGRDEVPSAEVQLVHVAVHHLYVEFVVLAQELSHLRLWMDTWSRLRLILLRSQNVSRSSLCPVGPPAVRTGPRPGWWCPACPGPAGTGCPALASCWNCRDERWG